MDAGPGNHIPGALHEQSGSRTGEPAGDYAGQASCSSQNGFLERHSARDEHPGSSAFTADQS